ncbi:hypothetical protein QR685DRAFT_598333 [Neurospora intermedia]|uniref:Uncharacterized protein n=1 Tax=Neurospora intermedia TaxID=5142 RepID=A0ABR3DBH1_NEUIN
MAAGGNFSRVEDPKWAKPRLIQPITGPGADNGGDQVECRAAETQASGVCQPVPCRSRYTKKTGSSKSKLPTVLSPAVAQRSKLETSICTKVGYRGSEWPSSRATYIVTQDTLTPLDAHGVWKELECRLAKT